MQTDSTFFVIRDKGTRAGKVSQRISPLLRGMYITPRFFGKIPLSLHKILLYLIMQEVTGEDILNYLRENKSYLFSEYHLTKMGLFGSFAKGDVTASSDIDLLVEFEPDTEELLEKKTRIKNMIKRQFNLEVDICREKYIKPYFKSQILQSVIYV